jgi:transcriptional regulator with XRE-family HTH domain
MDGNKRKRLEQKGWKVGSVQETLDLTDADMAYIEMKSALARSVRERRAEEGLTQTQLAKLLKSSQSRVAALESGTGSVDALVRALFAMGDSAKSLSMRVLSNPEPAPVRRAGKRKATTILRGSRNGLPSAGLYKVTLSPRRRGKKKKKVG